MGCEPIGLVLRDRIDGLAARDAHLHRAEVFEVARDRCLGRHDPLVCEQLDELRLARDRVLAEEEGAIRCWRCAFVGLPFAVLMTAGRTEAPGRHASGSPPAATRGNCLRSVDDQHSDFHAAVRGKAVEEDRVRSCACHRRVIDDEAGERPKAICGFVLLAHRRPHVGVHDIRTGDCRGRVGRELCVGALELVAGGRRDAHLHPDQGRREPRATGRRCRRRRPRACDRKARRRTGGS